MDIISSTAPKSSTSDTTFLNYLLIVDAYSKIPKLDGMEKITTEEVMDKLDMLKSRFREIDQLGWWDLERISADAGTQFTSKDFKDECQTRGFRLTLAEPEHHIISNCPKPPKDNNKRRRQVRFNEKGNCACNNGENDDDHKIYASMA